MKSKNRHKAVFLDRDGVINRAIVRKGRPYAPTSVKDFKILSGVKRAIKNLRAAGFKIIVVTNQPDVGAGKQSRAVVETIHRKITRQLHLDGVKVCYHTEADGCACRKPKPGLLTQTAFEASIDLKSSFMVGDRWRDVEAGSAAGCVTILIEAGYKEKKAKKPDAVTSSLLEASRLILSGNIGVKK